MHEIPPADPIGRALSAANGSATERIEALWHQYRDEEREAFEPYWIGSDMEALVTWDHYKAMFKRFPSFPDWLRTRGYLAAGS